MKIREALDDIVGIAKIALNVNSFENSNNSELWRIIDKCKSALSAPPRQCDVGTAAEQYKRYLAHCRRTPHCTGCKAFTNYLERCEFAWAQMPYEAQEGGKQ